MPLPTPDSGSRQRRWAPVQEPPRQSPASQLPSWNDAPAPPAAPGVEVPKPPTQDTWEPTTWSDLGRTFSKAINSFAGPEETPPQAPVTTNPAAQPQGFSNISVGGGVITIPGLYEQEQLLIDNARAKVHNENRQVMKKGGRRRDVYEMTWDDYNALSEKQRAAVDFNTELVAATRRDLKMQDQYNPSEEQRSAYNAAVAKIFGEDRGSDLYAPETMALLEQIGYNGQQQGADLDNFLRLRAAITERDLKGLELKSVTPQVSAPKPVGAAAGERYAMTAALATASQQRLDQVMANTENILGTAIQSAMNARQDDIVSMGGYSSDGKTLPGFGVGQFNDAGEATNMDGYFQQAFAKLANAENSGGSMKALLKAINSDISAKGAEQDWLNYVDIRTRQATQYDLPFAEEGVNVRTPEEIRKLLKLEN